MSLPGHRRSRRDSLLGEAVTWVRTDDAAPLHPKFFRAGVAAYGWWHAAVSYCNRYLTEGHIPDRDLDLVMPGTPTSMVTELAARLVHEGALERDTDGYIVHDYHHYQPTRKQVMARRRMRSRIGRQGGVKSGISRKQLASRLSEPLASTSANPDPTRPDPTRPDPITTPPESPPAPVFRTPTSILEALDQCRRLGAVPKLRTPEWWQSILRAYPLPDYPAVILDAESYLATTKKTYTDLAAFLRNSIKSRV